MKDPVFLSKSDAYHSLRGLVEHIETLDDSLVIELSAYNPIYYDSDDEVMYPKKSNRIEEPRDEVVYYEDDDIDYQDSDDDSE